MHRYYKNFELPGYGLQAPIIFLVNDIAHLRTIRSPFYRLARRQGMLDSRSVKWFHEKFTAYSRFVNSETVTEAELWSLLSSHLSCSPNEAIALLNELTSIETKKFLHCCASLIPFEPGNRLTHQGDVSYAYNILVSGRIRSQTFLRPAKEYGRSGQHFGANGLTGHQCHRDLDAVESGEMLILSGLAFQRFYHTHPEIAHKITRRMLALQRSRYTEQA